MSEAPLVSVAVCPHPPLLVPEIAGAAAGELDALRTACDEAVRRLLAAAPDLVVVVGSGPEDTWYPSVDGSLRRYTGDRGTGDPAEPPLSVTLGGWLLRRAGTPVVRRGRTVPPDTPIARCLAVGAELVSVPQRIGLLVMGDGSARRTDRAPGHFHPEAEAFDAGVAAALRTADTDALLKLDPELATGLMAAGRAPWQVLAGAAAAREWRADLLYDEAPYGVGYLVASWT